MALATPFIQRLGILLLIPILFVAGFMITGFYRIPENSIGVIRQAGSGVILEWVAPGIEWISPLSGRLELAPLSGKIIMAYYMLGDFHEMKAVEEVSADGAIVRLHVCVEYKVAAEAARRIIRDYGGLFPQEYITFEAGRMMRPRIRETQADSFRDPVFYRELLKETSEQTLHTLRQRGIDLMLLQILRYQDHEAEILDMNPDEIDFYRQLGVLKTDQANPSDSNTQLPEKHGRQTQKSGKQLPMDLSQSQSAVRDGFEGTAYETR